MGVPVARDPVKSWRSAVSRRTIDDVALQIGEKLRPRRVLLFGSHAHGRPGPDTDVDLLVVMDTPLKPTEQAARICQALEYHFGLDLVVITPEVLGRRLALGDSFLREIVELGTVLAEAVGHRVGGDHPAR